MNGDCDSTDRQPNGDGRQILRISDPAFLRFGRRGSVAFLVIGSLLIAGWQAHLIRTQTGPGSYRLAQRPGVDLDSRFWKGIGFRELRAQKYLYFLHHADLFPVTTSRALYMLPDDSEGAWRYLRSHGYELAMEDHDFLTTGDLGKIFLMYPALWIRGDVSKATVLDFNRALGIVSLLALFVSLSLFDHRMFAVILVVVLGSNPFQLFELHGRSNVFAHGVPIASLMLALHVPLVLGRAGGRAAFVLPIVSGVFLASVRETRLESALPILSVALVYLLARGGFTRRLALIGMLALSFAVTTALWNQYWTTKFGEAHRVVSEFGGETFDAPRNEHHAFWHAIWCGLGDFGRDRGYRWHDRTAYRYGISEMNRRFGTRFVLGVGPERFFIRDRTRASYKFKPETLDEYSTVMRDKVLSDIRGHPGWYAGVLGKRVARVLNDTTPIRLTMGGSGSIDVPLSAWWFLPVFVCVLAFRRWDQAKLLAFFLPASLTPILVYSGHGLTYQSVFHLVLFAIAACWGVHLVGRIREYARRRRTA